MTPLKRAVSSSTCCCDKSCRAKKTCSYNGMLMPLHGFATIRRQAPRAFRERLESLRRREHGTSDHTALPASLRTKALLEASDGTAAVRSAPGRDRAEAGVIEALTRNATRKAPKCC